MKLTTLPHCRSALGPSGWFHKPFSPQGRSEEQGVLRKKNVQERLLAHRVQQRSATSQESDPSRQVNALIVHKFTFLSISPDKKDDGAGVISFAKCLGNVCLLLGSQDTIFVSKSCCVGCEQGVSSDRVQLPPVQTVGPPQPLLDSITAHVSMVTSAKEAGRTCCSVSIW